MYDMRMIRKRIRILGVMIALLVIPTLPAYAYINPGTGSMIVQLIAAVVLSAGAMLGIFRQAIKRVFLRIFKRRKNSAAENSHPADSNKIEELDVKHDSQER